MSQIRIPDVSNYQPNVDWPTVVASGCAGGICKASEGINFVDKTFGRNWAVLGQLNVARGAYHFARPGSSMPDRQALKFLSAVQTWKAGDLLVLDLEVGDGNLSSWALGFLQAVQAQTKLVPWLYSYGPFVRAHLTDPKLAAYPLWLAAYQDRPPPCPPPWQAYQLWQHTDKARIPGIAGPCDESVGDIAAPLPGPAPQQSAAAHTETVPIPVHDFEEASVKQTMMHIGKLDDQGNGWSDWNPGLGRDPNIIGLVLLGPSPLDDGYWPQQANVNLAAQPRGGVVRVSVRGGTPGDTVTCFVTVS